MASTIFIPDLVEETPNGIFASGPIRASLPVLVAPTGEDRKAAHNTIRQELVVVACANLKEYNFRFDSSVVRAVAREGFLQLGRLIGRHRGAPLSLFGHADPVGPLDYNQALSERRARAIFAVLVRDPKIWEQLFTNQEKAIGDDWGSAALDEMVAGLGVPAGTSTKGLAPETADGIRRILGLPAGASVNNSAVRLALFERYMDFLRDGLDGAVKFPVLSATDDFLGRGKQRATLQGCSKFNPQLLFKKSDQDRFDKDKVKALKEERDAKNEPNRRVVIYLFKPGTVVDPDVWPCPTAQQGPQRCLARQWSDAEDRREKRFVDHARRFGRAVRPEARVLEPANPALAQRLGEEETTFGCRFYHGLALHSPCERDLKMWGLRIRVDAPTLREPGGLNQSNRKVPLADRRFVAVMGTAPDAPTVRGRTTAGGIIGLPFFDPNILITLKLDAFAALVPPPPPNPDQPKSDSDRFDDEDQFLVLRLEGSKLRPIRVRDERSLGFDPDFDGDPEPISEEDGRIGVLQRLYNLGYGKDDTGGDRFGNWSNDERREFVKQFQRDNNLTADGVVTPETRDKLIEVHGS
ncbi:MAG: peptidoglycan-binding protein [Gemmatimonadales bacterium]